MIFDWYKDMDNTNPKFRDFYAMIDGISVISVYCQRSGGKYPEWVVVTQNKIPRGFSTIKKMSPKNFLQRVENGLNLLNDDARFNVLNDIFSEEFRFIDKDFKRLQKVKPI